MTFDFIFMARPKLNNPTAPSAENRLPSFHRLMPSAFSLIELFVAKWPRRQNRNAGNTHEKWPQLV